MSIIKARSPFTIKEVEAAPPVVLPVFTCAETSITGLAIAADGTVTNPTVSVGTFHSIEPSSFTTVEEDTVHNVTVFVTYNSATHRPPSETSSEIGCVVQVTQEGTPTVDNNCKNWQVRNPHPTDQAFVNYQDCSNTNTTLYVPAATNQVICVYTGTVPTVMGTLNLAYAINQNTNCT